MKKLLAFDIGTRRTGVAWFDPAHAIPLPLDTIHHTSRKELLRAVMGLIRERQADAVIIGLPLLLSGKEGSQVDYVRGFAEEVERRGVAVELLDERFTTKRQKNYDGDAAAATELLRMYISRTFDK